MSTSTCHIVLITALERGLTRNPRIRVWEEIWSIEMLLFSSSTILRSIGRGILNTPGNRRKCYTSWPSARAPAGKLIIPRRSGPKYPINMSPIVDIALAVTLNTPFQLIVGKI